MDRVKLEDIIPRFEQAPALSLFSIALFVVILASLVWANVRAVKNAPTPGAWRFRTAFFSVCWLVLVVIYGTQVIVLISGGGLPSWTGLAHGPLLFILVTSSLLWMAKPMQRPK